MATQARTPDQLLKQSAQAMVSGNWELGLRHARALLTIHTLSRAQFGAGLAHLCVHLTQLARSEEAAPACNDSLARAALVELTVTHLTGLQASSGCLQHAEQILAEP
ncbi:MAG: hypothetical protein AB7E79_09560 [Rhodospirillaceae bacterium]